MCLFGYFIHIILRKIVKSKVLNVQENQHLEGLIRGTPHLDWARAK